MNFLRRASRQSTDRGLSEDDIRTLRQQRRRSSIVVAQTVSAEEPVFTTPIQPAVEIFPFSTHNEQQILIISPDPMNKNFTILRANGAEQFLTVSTPTLSISAQSHAKQFYGRLPKHLTRDMGKRKDIGPGDYNHNFNHSNKDSQTNGHSNDKKAESADPQLQEATITKLFTLERDTLSIRRRHHVTDPYSGKKLLLIEFAASSSWDAHALKANIELLNKYSDNAAVEPVRLKWQGKRHSLEGVLELSQAGRTNGKPVAVCAKGEETAESGDYILYVAPGMDACVAVCVVMAVDDRVRRGSDDNSTSHAHAHAHGVQGGGGDGGAAPGAAAAASEPAKEDGVKWAEGYQ